MVNEKRSPAVNSTLWLRIVNSITLIFVIVWECFEFQNNFLYFSAFEKLAVVGINVVSLIICGVSWVLFHRNKRKPEKDAVIINSEICAFGFLVMLVTVYLLDDTQSFIGEILGVLAWMYAGIGFLVCVPLSYVALYIAVKKQRITLAKITTMIISVGVSAIVVLWELIDLMYCSFSLFAVLGPVLMLSTFVIYFYILEKIREPKRLKVNGEYRIIQRDDNDSDSVGIGTS